MLEKRRLIIIAGQEGTGEYRYVRIDNGSLSVAQTVEQIVAALPEVFRA